MKSKRDLQCIFYLQQQIVRTQFLQVVLSHRSNSNSRLHNNNNNNNNHHLNNLCNNNNRSRQRHHNLRNSNNNNNIKCSSNNNNRSHYSNNLNPVIIELRQHLQLRNLSNKLLYNRCKLPVALELVQHK